MALIILKHVAPQECVIVAVILLTGIFSAAAVAQGADAPAFQAERARGTLGGSTSTQILSHPPAAKPVDLASLEQRRHAEQMQFLTEMNQLTIELYRRHSDPKVAHADTPKLVKRLKELAKKLHES